MDHGKYGTRTQLAFATTAAREKIQELLALFPSLQAEFTTNHTAPVVRAKRGPYRKRQPPQPTTNRHGAAARKKLSEAMKARWAQAKAAGTTLMEQGDFTATPAIKTETPRERKNRLQREWRVNRKKKGAK